MRETMKRTLATLLSVVMVVVCCVSGLTLPAAAEPVEGNLLAGKVDASYTMQGGDADRLIEADVALKSGTRYAVRITAKADAKGTVTFPNVSVTSITIAVTTEWRVYQSMFTMTADTDLYAMKIKFTGTAATQSLTVKDIQLLEAPTDGTFNLIPGGTMDAQSSFMSEAFSKGLPLEADPDDPNNRVAHFDKKDGANYAFMWDASGIDFTNGKVLKLVFRLKGGQLRLDCRDANAIKLSNPDAVSVTGGGQYSYYKTDVWTECVYYVKPSAPQKLGNSYVIGARGGSNAGTEMWLDDVQMYEITPATGITLDKTTLSMAPSSIDQLIAQAAPTGSMLLNDSMTWDSSNPAVVQVDQTGMLVAMGAHGESATVTVTTGEGYTASCVVTIDENAGGSGPVSSNLLDGKVNASYTMKGGDAPLTVSAAALMKASTRYAIRVTAKADAAATITFPGVTSGSMTVLDHGEWRTYQVMFTPTAMSLNFKMQVTFSGTATTDTLEFKDIQLLQAPTDGTFNLLPASSADAETTFLSKAFAMGLERVADPDDPTNTVLHFRSDTNTCNYWDMTGVSFTTGKIMKLTFKIKGGMMRVDCGDGSPAYMDNPDAVKVAQNGKLTYYQRDEWTQVSYYIKPSSANQIPWFMLSHRGLSAELTEVWLDDLQMYEVTPSTGITLNTDALAVAPANFAQLTVIGTPADTMLVNTTYTWTSNNESVIRVDAQGKVTALGDHGQSVTVTVKNGDGFTASCVVTIDNTAPSLPQVDAITLTPSGAELDIGDTVTLTVNGIPAENIIGRVTYTSNNPAVATVDQNGMVTAHGAGFATVTATTQFGKTSVANFTVHAQPNLLVNGDFEQDSSVSWRNTTALKDGIGKYGSRAYHLYQEGDAAVGTYYSRDIALKPATKYIVSYDYKVEEGAGFRLYAAELGAGNLTPTVFCEPGTLDTAEWQHTEKVFTTADFFDAEAGWALVLTTSSSDNLGGAGSAYIDNLAIREYVVGEPDQTIEIEQQDVVLAPSRTTKLTVRATPDTADLNALEWTSSNEDVAYVVSGHVIGVGAGTATITVKTKSSKTATTTVTVNGAASPLTNGSFETTAGWTLSGNVQYATGKGVIRSTGLLLMPADGSKAAGSISQVITGLKPDSAYQLHLQLRRTSNANSFFKVKLLDAEGQVISESRGGGSTGTVKYTSDFYKYDIVTPDTIQETDQLTLVLEYVEGVAHFTFDNFILAEATSEVDLIVSDLFWTPEGDQLTPDTPVRFSVAFINQGAEDYVGGKPITIDILVDGKKVKSLTHVGHILRGELMVIACEDADTWAATLGDHTITAVINSTMTVLEMDETNNHLSYNLRVAEESAFVSAPNAALKQGFNRLVFSDHFTSTATVDAAATGKPGYKWYITRPWGEATLTADDYRIEDGVLYVTTKDTKWNYSMATIDAKNAGVGFTFNKGYLEIRVRMKATGETGEVTGIRVPAVWAHPADTIWGTREAGKTSVELDWFEYWGNKYGALRFDTTLHETRFDLEGNEIGKVSHGEKHTESIGDYKWHTYGMAWNSGVLKTYFDGELIGTLTYSEDGYPDPMPSGSVNIEAGSADAHEGLWSALDYQNMPIILGGASDFPLEVDWIHVWQSDGTVEPEKDTPASYAGAFVRQYLRGVDGKIYTGLTLDNYQQILSGEMVYLELSSAERVAIDAAIGGSYIDWIAEIYDTISKVENFISFYASAENGAPYTTVDLTNYAWIAGAQPEWEGLSAFTQSLIDHTLDVYGLMTFTDLLAMALAFEAPAVSPGPTPGTVSLTWLWIALAVVGALIVVGGTVIAILLFAGKRKKKNGQAV